MSFFNIEERNSGINSTFVNDESKLNVRTNYMIYLARFFHHHSRSLRIFLVADFNNRRFAFIAADSVCETKHRRDK